MLETNESFSVNLTFLRCAIIAVQFKLFKGLNFIMVVYTVGTFDLLHVGHLALLEYCKTLGDTVAVGVASDEVVKLYKPNIPVIPLDQRMEMLLALRCVDIVRPYHELDYISVCKEVKADIFVIGEDWGEKTTQRRCRKLFKSSRKKNCASSV